MKNGNKKSKSVYIIVFLLTFTITILALFIWNTYFSDNQYSKDSYEAEKTSTSENDKSNENNEEQKVPNITEEIISSFSTKVFSTDPARANNINITCTKLNDTIIANGSNFSFCDTVGPATSAEGYQKADVFDAKGTKKKGLGGGNCQISSTLYNALISVSGVTVTERHTHSNYVPYIARGQDAAVAYGSYDLKFVNQTGFDIKIKVSSSPSSVDVTLLKLIYS